MAEQRLDQIVDIYICLSCNMCSSDEYYKFDSEFVCYAFLPPLSNRAIEFSEIYDTLS